MSSVSSVSTTSAITRVKKSATSAINPYDILQANIEAIGGESEWENDANGYQEGTITINDTDYNYYQWMRRPSNSREEIWSTDGSSELYATGDDGENVWEYRDEDVTSSTEDDKVREAMDGLNNLDYMDSSNNLFTVTFNKITYIDGKRNYEVKITNTATDMVVYRDFDADTFMLTQETRDSSEATDGAIVTTKFDDYRDVAGLMESFHRTVNNVTTGEEQEITLKKYKRNIQMQDALFDKPENKSMSLTNKTLDASVLDDEDKSYKLNS